MIPTIKGVSRSLGQIRLSFHHSLTPKKSLNWIFLAPGEKIKFNEAIFEKNIFKPIWL